MKFHRSNNMWSSEHGSALPPTTRNVVMRRSLPVFALMLASIWYSQAASSFGGFGNFGNLMETIECHRKPGSDYLVCKPKDSPGEEIKTEVVDTQTTTETYSEREYGEERVTVTRSEPVEISRNVSSNTERTKDDENERWVDTTTTTTTIVYEHKSVKTVVVPWTDTTYEVSVTTTTYEDGTTETERGKPEVTEVVEGEDRTVSNDSWTTQEDIVEVTVSYEPYLPYVDDLIPSMVIDDAMSLDPAKDYVWSHIESLDITQDLGMECHDPSLWGNHVSDSWYNLRPEDLNSDQYPDYLVSITCHNDLRFEGKSIRYDYEGLLWSNGFISMFCGSEDGLYNCTEEVTGHKDVIDFSGDVLSGFLALPQIILHDLNEDGIKDMIVPAGTDDGWSPGMYSKPDGSPRDCTKGECDFYQAYYDRMGLTRNEVIDVCRDEKCWVQTAQAMYAVSGPDGTWEVKVFPQPNLFAQYLGSTELYLKDGVYHVNFRGWDADQLNWFTFNKEKNEFEFVHRSYGESVSNNNEMPFDPRANNREYRSVYARGGSGIYAGESKSDWIAIGDFEYQVQNSDPNKSEVMVNSGGICNDWLTAPRDKCQVFQKGILKKDASENITRIIEYDLEDWIEETRPVDEYDVKNGSVVLQDWNQMGSPMGVKIHDIWMTLHYGEARHNLQVAIKQLEENNPDAPWYLIVSIEGRLDIRDPGAEFMPEILHRCEWEGYNRPTGWTYPDLVDFHDDRCWQYAIATVLKYEIDFESGTLTYAGTLLDQPFIYNGLDSVGPDTWEWADLNGDGWKDIRVTASGSTMIFASNEQGALMYVDSDQITPLMPYGRGVGLTSDWKTTAIQNIPYERHGDSAYAFSDINGDGLTDFYAVVDGDYINYYNPSKKRGAVDLVELYDRNKFYLDVVISEYEPISEADLPDGQQVRDRIDACIERATLYRDDFWYTILTTPHCLQHEMRLPKN